MFIVKAEAEKHIRGHILRLKKQAKAGKARQAEQKRQEEERLKMEQERLKKIREVKDKHNEKVNEHKKKHKYLMRNCDDCTALIRGYQTYNSYYNPWANAYYGSSMSTHYVSPSSMGGAGGIIDAEEQGDDLNRIIM